MSYIRHIRWNGHFCQTNAIRKCRIPDIGHAIWNHDFPQILTTTKRGIVNLCYTKWDFDITIDPVEEYCSFFVQQ